MERDQEDCASELNGTCHDDFNKIVTIAAVKLAS